ncbi:MAG: class I SAM-dependent DNA methyltransferase, partial [Candidatus Aminicenantes bacterium]|nr:class I SAM-dependent DNA methyltransferase [Candidatus Aminicenantes bacterium]
MALSWNEIKDRAVQFSKEWGNAFNEDADAKPFLVAFFNVFGINQRKVASFEHRVKKLDEHEGYIDMLWKGTLLVEMKSKGKNLDKAYQQARAYLQGLKQHELPRYILVRLLFCLFADDSTIFNRDIFADFIEQKTTEDGSDLAARLSELFYILDTPREKRLKNIDEQLNEFPYVNGKLFEETLPPASFDSEMRRILIECCYLDWGKISPAIFGSMFQSVMNPVERRNLGAHYTSEKNILKLIKPLFLDDLWAEF